MRNYVIKILIFGTLLLTGIYLFLLILHASRDTSPLQCLTLSYHTHPEEKLFWIIDYFPFAAIIAFIGANIIWFLIELLLVEPSYLPAHDTGDIAQLTKKSTQPINHLHDALYTCPNINADKIEAELISQGVSIATHPKWTRNS